MRRVALIMIWGVLALFMTAGIAYAAGIYGTYADEYVYGTADADFISAGPGSDGIYGEAGDDVVYAADGLYPGYSAADTISCGDGYDTAVIDSSDTALTDCEVIEYDATVYTPAT